MATLSGSRVEWGAWPALRTETWLLAVLAATVLLQCPLVAFRAVNWDEFYHYSVVEKLAHGTLTAPLQTLYARAFTWVTTLPGTGVDHILVIRLFMLGCELVTLAAIVGMASRFADRATGLLCALAYLSAGYVFQHGTSFRFDPPATALLMSALWLFLCRPLDVRAMVLGGLLLGTAGMLTIKSVLYAPALAGVLWLRWSEHRFSYAYLGRMAATGLAALIAFAGIYWLHSRGLGAAAEASAADTIDASAEKMFSLGYQPFWPYVPAGAARAPILAVLLLLIPLGLWRGERPAPQRLALLGFYLPLTTLLFYRNTAPYYYVFMLAPVAVACCAVLPSVAERYGAKAVAAVFVLSAAALLAAETWGTLDKQRQIQLGADAIFARPVAYFDNVAILGRYPKANAFMTTWGTERYLKGAEPSLRETMARQTVPLFVEDGTRFTATMTSREPDPNFLPADLAALHTNFIRFWGPLWIAGRLVPADGREHAEEFLVPGPYTVRDAPVVIDGQAREPGAIVSLGRGLHRVQANAGKPGRLVWGERLRPPAAQPPAPPYWTEF
jgi:hypothetical protein